MFMWKGKTYLYVLSNEEDAAAADDHDDAKCSRYYICYMS